MNIEHAEQVEFNDLLKTRFDTVICACGFETRSTFLAKQFNSDYISSNKVAFIFKDRIVFSRKKNEKFYNENKFTIIECSGDDATPIQEYITEILESSSNDTIRILVDYSSMTRVWYASIIYLLLNQKLNKKVEIFFSYSFSKFKPPPAPAPNTFMEPISGFCNLRLPNKKTALIMGIGYELFRAQGFYEYLDPAYTSILFSDPAVDNKYTEFIIKNNPFFFQNREKFRLLSYPIENLRITDTLLCNLSLSLSKEYRVILAPMGPKPFTLLSLLLSAKYRFLDVWRVSSGILAPPVDRVPTGNVIICKVIFTPKSDSN